MAEASPSSPGGKVFLCYRREDSADITGRFYDRLVQRFGRDAVFKDVDSIPLGVDFRTHIDRIIKKVSVVVVLIGDRWLEARSADGKVRLEQPLDHVRIEMVSALARDIPIIPLLVRNAEMPSPEALPEPLREFAYRNGTALRSDPHFHSDASFVIGHLEKILVSEETEIIVEAEAQPQAPQVAAPQAPMSSQSSIAAPPKVPLPPAADVPVSKPEKREGAQLADGTLAGPPVISSERLEPKVAPEIRHSFSPAESISGAEDNEGEASWRIWAHEHPAAVLVAMITLVWTVVGCIVHFAWLGYYLGTFGDIIRAALLSGGEALVLRRHIRRPWLWFGSTYVGVLLGFMGGGLVPSISGALLVAGARLWCFPKKGRRHLWWLVAAPLIPLLVGLLLQAVGIYSSLVGHMLMGLLMGLVLAWILRPRLNDWGTEPEGISKRPGCPPETQ